MQLVEAVEFIVVILPYFLFLAVMSLAILLAATGGMALLGAAVATPLLYVLPDVRRFLLVASGGRPDDDAPPWRVAARPRSVLLTVGFGRGAPSFAPSAAVLTAVTGAVGAGR